MIDGIEKFLSQEIEIYGDELAFARLTAQKTQKVEAIQSTPLQTVNTVDELSQTLTACSNCPAAASRNNIVFSQGSPSSPIMLIGHFPSNEDNASGQLFSGRAGELLDKMLSAIQLSRNDFYICNLVKCLPDSPKIAKLARECRPYLIKQIEQVNPKIILCMGEIVGQSLLKKVDKIASLREQNLRYQAAQVVVTFHPADLLADAQLKRPAWADLQKFKEYYSELVD